MIYHTKSFSLSLLIHLLIIAFIYYGYRTFHSENNAIKEEKICVKLCNIKSQTQPVHTTVAKAKAVPKRVVSEHSNQKEQKKVPKVVKKKALVKKTKVVKKRKVIASKKNLHTTQSKKIEKVKSKPIENTLKPLATTQVPLKKKSIKTAQVAQRAYLQENINKISELIRENLYYPRRARKRAIEGIVVVTFVLHKDARVTDVHILSVNRAILGRAAVKTIEELSGKFPKPHEVITLKVPINYMLE